MKKGTYIWSLLTKRKKAKKLSTGSSRSKSARSSEIDSSSRSGSSCHRVRSRSWKKRRVCKHHRRRLSRKAKRHWKATLL